MIDLRDCDVEELTRDDFIDGESSYTAYFTISMLRLAKIVTDVVRYKYSPVPLSKRPQEDVEAQMHLELQNWQAGLEPLLLLLHRPSLNDAKHSVDERDFSTHLAFYAAIQICDLATDISNFFEANEFPIYAEMIILSAMVFHSVETQSTYEEDLIHRRKQASISCLLELDRIFCAIPKYKQFFGDKIGIWERLNTKGKENTTTRGLVGHSESSEKETGLNGLV
ncbi:hypothetical protein DTO271D3_4735 [Paecilomyces variotii]|nr:hypothetical protein DTO207G8_1504 [Paecilomyces variotii]KAJ9282216.1 hypothetical protein DTO021D3_968 [Paecilomyces variotii]KAJ9314996.1 hypothetical protein DTO271D3_4735 [Paecilomyces variotii]KAJ9361586.1 hypothetical protein DTO027B9_747 [Paecilomyces variotii]KAJ9386596.1 hypothetical protein DTO032I4_3692 [Paecilomyces variotii]